jgi:Type II site-specific deoxyribonuclease
MPSLKELVRIAKGLPEDRLGVLIDLADALGRNITVNVNPKSDLATTSFAENFSGRLLAYHAFHEQKLTKKTFEFVFCAASHAAGRKASITTNSVNAGADVTVDGVAFSLKTEGAHSMTKSEITVSKLMEARWIRECRKPEDFAREVTTRVVEHLNEYERIITLRAFERPKYFEYDLIEIPLKVLRSVGRLKAVDFSQRTPNGGSSARVTYSGETAFTLRLDGSVEKITVSGLRTSLCVHHATWRVNRS